MKKLSSVLMAFVLTASLTACSTDTGSKPEEKSAQETKTQAIDPHEFSGVVNVKPVGDPKPIVDKAPEQQLPAQVTDFEGNQVQVTDTSRILALDIYGTISRTLISLGFADKLVGRTISDTEQILKDLPVVTQEGHSLNAEAIAQLKPTLIFTDKSVGPPEVLEQLKQTGTTIVTLSSERSIDNVAEQIKFIADAMGVSKIGEKLAKQAQDDIEQARKDVKAMIPEKMEPLKATFLYVRGNGGVFFIFGKGEGSDDLISNVYAKDVASETGLKGIVPATAESLVTLNPDVFLVMDKGLESTGNLEGLLQRPGVAQTTAGKKQRVVAIPDGQALSFGPQTGQMLRNLGEALYLNK